MLNLWNIRICSLLLIQFITSFALIYKQKEKRSYFTEIFLLIFSIWYGYYGVPILLEKTNLFIVRYVYNNYSFTIDKLVWYLVEYIVLKILLVIIVSALKYFSFYALVSIANRDGKIARLGYKIFGKKNFVRITYTLWNRVDYGIRFKKGIPKMCNKKHEKTGIKFDKNGFPIFNPIVTVKISRKLYKKSDAVQFRECNKMLCEMIRKDAKLRRKFLKAEIESFRKNIVPPKYTWHHHQDKGVMQLVPRSVHGKVFHYGGFHVWGREHRRR